MGRVAKRERGRERLFLFCGNRLKKRSCRQGKLLGLQTVIPRPLIKQVIADQSGQGCCGNKKRKAYNEKKGQQDLPPDAGSETMLFSPGR